MQLPQSLITTSTRTGAWLVYCAAQVRSADNTLFSAGFKVSDIVTTIGDVHHIFPRKYLQKDFELPQRLYNQVANYAFLEKRINIAIGAQCPGDYFTTALDACNSGSSYFGDISDERTLMENLTENCIPEDIFFMTGADYDRFLNERRELMAKKIKEYFFSL